MTRANRICLPIALAAALTGLSGFAATSAYATSPIGYVALGDSYSSGAGAGDYSDGSCQQSAHAFPELWHDAHGGSFVNETCAGATISDVINSQLGALSAGTTLVSVTIGGNDIGFAKVMVTCVLGSDSACIHAINQAERRARTTLPGALGTVLSDIASLAKNAKIVILGYPQFYDLAKSSTCVGLSRTKRTHLNQGASVLDGVISAAASRHGDTFVDVTPFFARHQICDAGSYLIAVDLFNLAHSFHPNAHGQKYGYLRALDSAMR